MKNGALYVVDTNVPIIANGDATVSEDCVLACTKELKAVMESGRVALDDKWLIIQEYQRKLPARGQRGVGDAFLKWVLTHQANPKRCELVRVSYRDSDHTDFHQFPDHPGLAAFDKDDRKFVAVAAAHTKHPPILQAADSKWWGWKQALKECGIQVYFLCPEDIRRLFAKKGGRNS